VPNLFDDFFNPSYGHALWTSIVHGLQVLVVIGAAGGLLTFLSGGTQPKHWPKSEH
jgi:hypothetical protein